MEASDEEDKQYIQRKIEILNAELEDIKSKQGKEITDGHGS